MRGSSERDCEGVRMEETKQQLRILREVKQENQKQGNHLALEIVELQIQEKRQLLKSLQEERQKERTMLGALRDALKEKQEPVKRKPNRVRNKIYREK